MMLVGGSMAETPAQHADRSLDEALEETFPASDPPANTVETGIGIDVPASETPEDGTGDETRGGRASLGAHREQRIDA
jgi:hypothetical protein